MSDLELRGKVEVIGEEIPNIAGGFGESKRSMLSKEIASFHNKELKHVNEAINKNLNRFRSKVDIIDLKDTDFVVELVDRNILSQM